MNKILRKLSEDKLIIFVCLIAALLLWTSSQLGKTVEQNIVIELKFISSPNNTLASELPRELNIVINGSGWSLLFSKLQKNVIWNYELPAQKDVIFTEPLLDKKIKHDFELNNINIIKITPSHFIVKQDSLISKSVPIKSNISLSISSGYAKIEDPSILPTMIKLIGPEQMLSKLDYWSIGNIELSQLNNERLLKKTVKLNSGNNLLKLDPTEVIAQVNLEELTEKTLIIPIQIDKSRTNIDRIFPKEVEVKIRIGLSKYDNIKSSDFHLGIDLDSITQLNTYIVEIWDSPKGINILEISPSYVDVYFKVD